MATFIDVSFKLRLLADAITSELGRVAVDDISVPEPVDPKDELYFRKLVSWSYVALVEAFPIPEKQLMNLLRTTEASEHTRLSNTKNLVNALRTVQSHNTSKPSVSNNRQKVLAESWILTNGGTPCSWETCCIKFCAQLYDVFSSLSSAWAKVMLEEQDRTIFVNTLKLALDADWPAHAFDSAVEDAADAIGLTDFDVVAYRKIYFSEWKKFAEVFGDRQSAMKAVKRAISVKLRATFGDSLCSCDK